MSPPSDEFEKLIESHSRLMASAIRKVCGRKYGSLIPDVEQEVRLALWKRLQGGKEIEHPISYIYKVAITTAMAVLERFAGQVASSEFQEPAPSQRDAGRPGDLLPEERAHLLEQLLDQLPREQSRAMRAYMAGFNHKEVAALFGWTESTARHHIYRGIEELRALGKGGTPRV